MKIEFVTPKYRPPNFRGGIERYVDVVGRYLAASGDSVSVFAFAEDLPYVTNLSTRFLAVPKIPYVGVGTFYARTRKAWTDFDWISVQHPHLGLSVPAAKLVPTVHTTCLGESRSLRQASRSLKDRLRSFSLSTWGRHLEGKVYKKARAIVTLNDSLRSHLVEDYKLPQDAIHVVGNGVDTDLFMPPEHYVTPSRTDPIRALYVGRLHPRKNVALLLHAIARAKQPVHLTIVGDGPEFRSLQQLSAELEIEKHASFVGRKSGSALVEEYQTADVFLMPSSYEGVPLNVLEAKACGLPVVTAPFAGARNLVSDDTGFVRDPTPEAFSTMLDLLTSLDLPMLRARSRADALSRFSWATKVASLRDIYRGLEEQTPTPLPPAGLR